MTHRRYLPLYLLFVSLAVAQSAPPATAPLPKDPLELIKLAAPYYDFDDAAMKPWHLKANYQLYDDKGNPTETGVFEYWWASPKVKRLSWTRGAISRTTWHKADGSSAYLQSDAGIDFYEAKLETALTNPMRDAQKINPESSLLQREDRKMGDVKFPCVMVSPKMNQHGKILEIPLGLYPTYCFDPHLPVLRLSTSFGSTSITYNKQVKFNDKFLAKSVMMTQGTRKLLTAEVSELDAILPDDPALTPSPDAHVPKVGKVMISAGVAVGQLLTKQPPVYPSDAKEAHVSGTVALQATIGRDGQVHDLQVLSSPWPSLVTSAIEAVRHWTYRPYILNGEPVEVETTINVIYSLGN